MSIPDIVLSPHCDLHMALNGLPPGLRLQLRVERREQHAPPDFSYNLEPVTSQCEFDFFAPYQTLPTPHRLDNLPSVDPLTGFVTATTPGVYLFQVRFGAFYIVGRLQVHDTLLGWWFGHSSITAAVDPALAHTQPSIYASFSTDPSGADTVGDITGHGYVQLDPAVPGIMVVERDGRLRGLSEGNDVVTGTLNGISHSVPVRIVDYGRTRDELDVVRVHNLTNPADAHNMVFIGEGFRTDAADRTQFDEIVTKTVEELFSKPRHQPYGLLDKSFNVWKAYQPSAQHGLTCAFNVNDTAAPGAGVPPRGYPIPYNRNPKEDATKYTVETLVRRVGLPLRNETRNLAQLLSDWNSQSLDDFDATRVDQPLVDAWKSQKSDGILDARDTFFGFRLGARLGDRLSGISRPAVVMPPTTDATSDALLKPFVKRVYEFFTIEATRSALLDPRRHAVEVMADSFFGANPGNLVMRYLAGLRWRSAPHPAVGQEWQPDPAEVLFKRSRGFVGIIVNEGLHGGSNLCASTMTATTIGRDGQTDFAFTVNVHERRMGRTLPATFTAQVDSCIDTIAHEFGHSFNLGDEYEEFAGRDPNATFHGDIRFDNITRLGWIFHHGAVLPDGTVFLADDEIDPTNVKWFDLTRIKVSAMLTADAVPAGAAVTVTIDPRYIASWVAAKKKNLLAFLRARVFTSLGQQLPFPSDNAHILLGLTIGNIDEAHGTIALSGSSLPPAGSPVFKQGALLFVPVRAPDSSAAKVVEQKVLEKLTTTHTALNKQTDNTAVNSGSDSPVDIAGFSPPCKAFKVIGLYEGAAHYAGRDYRPAGLCKMRSGSPDDDGGEGEFCHVCKWLIVNRVDPNLHAILDDKFYPNARKGGDG
jgi:hypothetical protein